MKRSWIALVVGLLFAIGLGLAGMTRPEKVIGFLDVFGNWDPSLIFVMLGAISVHFVIYQLSRQKTSPLLDVQWHLPQKKEVTPSLVFGSLLFGTGWGLAGYCPGPAIVSIVTLGKEALLFTASMVLGMLAFHIFSKFKKLN